MKFKKYKIVEVKLNDLIPTTEKLLNKAQETVDEWTGKGWELINVSLGTNYMTSPIVIITLSFDEDKILAFKA